MNDPRGLATLPPRVLVVCTGNLCRSPLAGALLEKHLEDAGLTAIVSSAGTGAPEGQSPDRKLVRVADDLGVDVREHRSRPITAGLMRDADLVLTMTRRHVAEVAAVDPHVSERALPLRVAAWKARVLAGSLTSFPQWVARLAADVPEAERPRSSRADDVPDPIGRPLRHYRAMGQDVDDLVRTLVRHWSGRSPS